MAQVHLSLVTTLSPPKASELNFCWKSGSLSLFFSCLPSLPSWMVSYPETPWRYGHHWKCPIDGTSGAITLEVLRYPSSKAVMYFIQGGPMEVIVTIVRKLGCFTYLGNLTTYLYWGYNPITKYRLDISDVPFFFFGGGGDKFLLTWRGILLQILSCWIMETLEGDAATTKSLRLAKEIVIWFLGELSSTVNYVTGTNTFTLKTLQNMERHIVHEWYS